MFPSQNPQQQGHLLEIKQAISTENQSYDVSKAAIQAVLSSVPLLTHFQNPQQLRVPGLILITSCIPSPSALFIKQPSAVPGRDSPPHDYQGQSIRASHI